MDIQLLETFLVVCEERNLSRAAVRLFRTQPAVTRQIQALEALLEVRLLERTPRGVQPTAQGEELRARGARILSELRGLRDLGAGADGPSGELLLACSDTVACHFLAPFLGRLARECPRVRICITSGNTPGIVNLLAGPAMLLFLLPGSLPVVWFGLGLSAVLLAFAMGPQAAVIQTIVKVRMRAFAGSVTMTGATLFGMGFGPLVVAMVSDSLKPRFGALALRYSMLTAVIALILSGVCYIWASAYIKADMRKAQEEASGIA